MPAVPPADCALYRGGPREAARLPRLGILGQAGAFVWASERGVADRRPGAGRARLQSRSEDNTTSEVARVKRRAYRDWEYWGKPVPSFGRPSAELLIVGLAPGAHGSN